MSTERQKAAARQNLETARADQAARQEGRDVPRRSHGMTTSEEDQLPDDAFAFPKERKEPLVDAAHVRNAVARFDQVEGVSDAERDRAWQRIQSAARRLHVEIHEGDWRELFRGGGAH